MSRGKLFIENILVYGLGSVISKIIPLILLPVITRLLPSEEYYGANDLSSLIVSFGATMVMLGIYEGLFRVFFEKDENTYKKSVVSSGLGFVVISAFFAGIILLMLNKYIALYIFGDLKFRVIAIISTINMVISPISLILGSPTRMQNKRKVYLVTNTLSPILSYSISIPLILTGNALIAIPVGSLLSSIMIMTIFAILNHKWFNIKLVRKAYIVDMLKIGLPLLPNLIVYWIFNSFDRLMIGHMIDNSAVGIYGVGARIASVSQLIYTAFAGGWQFFAYSTMKESDQVETNSKLFELLALVAFISTTGLTMVSRTIFKILFEGNYIEGYKVVPYLFLSPLLLMLIQVGSSQLVIIKKTWPSTLILAIGAISNITLNLVLIKFIGIEGAAIGTLAGYIISLLLINKVLHRMKLFKISKKFYISLINMVTYILLWAIVLRNNNILLGIWTLISVGIYIKLYYKDLCQLVTLIIKSIKTKKKDQI